ncbi:VOC family protein [Nocardia cyriacigeorgica]|jgi:uncharacterized protein|uniref:VOC family protein n=2 Tax=Nocardia cyriacigeorgica TaxID=135487 RepID=UPI000CEA32B7|nr:VOC family protein [Nocardia cyriacigeorgica]AVH22765.1 glyoxalase [Nocardia cyriacigeorgica]MBF6325789.1 VOC family protein [Nocardia cyriacigeorgica]MBF6498562.1 VOC family protein [Nocardia cyriacigeorgica]PPJ03393.1 glyoxalase [Nocardia cyriacigeorgica]
MASNAAHRPGDPCWVDVYSSDPDRTIAFYGELFGWTAERDDDFGGYITFRSGGKAVGGGMGRMPDDPDSPDQWTVYLAVEDAEATAKAAVAHGGQVVVAPMAVGDLGSMAILGDSAGAGVGIWQAGTFGGFETAGLVEGGQWRDHHGAPSWFELTTGDFTGSVEFYRAVFGWDDLFPISDTPEFRYSTLHSTSPMLGGVMDGSTFLPPGSPGGWSVYFGADDVDATVAKAVRLGATVTAPAEDTPYGRLATLVDPNGARFSLGGDKG